MPPIDHAKNNILLREFRNGPVRWAGKRRIFLTTACSIPMSKAVLPTYFALANTHVSTAAVGFLAQPPTHHISLEFLKEIQKLCINVSGLLPGVIHGSKPTFQDDCLSLLQGE